MKTEILKINSGYSDARITLNPGETHEAAGSTKKVWIGPGTFRRITHGHGGRDDYAETARLTLKP
jgi:hypothetical protein